jgi:putative NIF3 family GTP cyclohydrolase 1 type 2
MTGQQIVDFVFEIAPNPSWADENIFEFGDGSQEVTAVGVAWWITSDIMRGLGEGGFQLGLTHERVIYDLTARYPWGQTLPAEDLAVNQRVAEIAARHRLSIHRFHSNLDLASWGIGRSVLEQLGWDRYPTDRSRGVPVVTIEPMSLRSLVDQVKAQLDLPFIRYDGDLDRIIRRVTVPWGGMCASWDAAACASPLGFDAIVGGDISDGLVRFARENGWAVVAGLHHATEAEGMRRLAQRLKELFPDLRVRFFENSHPWSVQT